MRSFVQDTESTPKGMFYLNGRKIRLRGANTMGFEKQDVMNGEYTGGNEIQVNIKDCAVTYAANAEFTVDDVEDRKILLQKDF